MKNYSVCHQPILLIITIPLLAIIFFYEYFYIYIFAFLVASDWNESLYFRVSFLKFWLIANYFWKYYM